MTLTHQYLGGLNGKSAWRWPRSLLRGAFAGQSAKFQANKNAAGASPDRCFTILFLNGDEQHLAAASAEQRDEILALIYAFLTAPMPSEALNDGEQAQERVLLRRSAGEADAGADDASRVMSVTVKASKRSTDTAGEPSAAGGSRVSCREESDSYDMVTDDAEGSTRKDAAESNEESAATADGGSSTLPPRALKVGSPKQVGFNPVLEFSPSADSIPTGSSAPVTTDGPPAYSVYPHLPPFTFFQPSSSTVVQQQQYQMQQQKKKQLEEQKESTPVQTPPPAASTTAPFLSAAGEKAASVPAPESMPLHSPEHVALLERHRAERRIELDSKVQSLQVYQTTLSEVRQCLLQVLSCTPPSFGPVISMCREVDHQLDDLTLLQTSELARMSTTMSTLHRTLDCMFVDAVAFDSRIGWKQMLKHAKALLGIKFDARMEIEFADKSTEQIGRLFKSIFDFLSTVSSKQFINDSIQQRIELRQQEVALVQQIQSLDLKLQSLETHKSENLFLSAQLAERKLRSALDTPEDRADKAVLEQLRAQVRAIDLQMRATYVQPHPVVILGVTLFVRQKKVIGNDPELQAQRDQVTSTIQQRLAAYFKRHQMESVWEAEIAQLRTRNLKIDTEMKAVEQAKHQPSVSLGHVRAQIATLEELIATNQGLLGGLPLEVLRGVCDACLLLRSQLQQAKQHAIETFTLAYEETRAIADFVHDCAETAAEQSPAALQIADRRLLQVQLIGIQVMEKQLTMLTDNTGRRTAAIAKSAAAGIKPGKPASATRIRA